MFGKKKCSNCNRKVGKDFDFCPYCANGLKDPKDYGLLGQDDDILAFNQPIFKSNKESDTFLDKIFESAFKVVEKQIQKISEEEMKAMRNSSRINNNSELNGNFQLFINGKRVNLPRNLAGVQIGEMNGNRITNNKIPNQQKAKMPKVSDETLKNSAKLPRKEPKTQLTRNSERVIYELDTPGIQSLNQVLINQLENSIEVRAYTDKTVFNKTLSIKLPLLQYTIKPEEGKLVLEFKAN